MNKYTLWITKNDQYYNVCASAIAFELNPFANIQLTNLWTL